MSWVLRSSVSSRRPSSAPTADGELVAKWLLFLIPAGYAVSFTVVGQLYVGDILAILAVPLVGVRGIRRYDVDSRGLALILGFLLLAAAVQILSDLVNGSELANAARGLARWGMSGVLIFVLHRLIGGSWPRLRLAILGAAASAVLRTTLFPDDFTASDPWKFGVAGAVSLAVMSYLSGPGRRSSYEASAVVAAGLAALNLIFGYRSMAGILLCASVLILFARPSNRQISRTRLVLASICLVLVGAASLSAYGALAANGYLGESAAQKYAAQSRTGGSILLAGRGEVLVAAKAIADRPLLGHGSWAEGDDYVRYARDLTRRGYNAYLPPGDYRIPTHSAVLGSWVEGGFVGVAFWLVVLSVAGRATQATLRTRQPLTPLVCYLAVATTWAICFSPYGADARLALALAIAVFLMASRMPGQVRTDD